MRVCMRLYVRTLYKFELLFRIDVGGSFAYVGVRECTCVRKINPLPKAPPDRKHDRKVYSLS